LILGQPLGAYIAPYNVLIRLTTFHVVFSMHLVTDVLLIFSIFFVQGGVVFISSEVSERLLPKFSQRAEEKQITLKTVCVGTIEQLKELVHLVASEQVQ